MKLIALEPEYEIILKSVRSLIEKGIVNESMQIPSLDGKPLYLAKQFRKFLLPMKESLKYPDRDKVLLVAPRLNMNENEIMQKILSETILTPNQFVFFGQHRIYMQEIKEKVNVYAQKEIRMEGIDDSCSSIMESVRGSGTLIVIIDLDIVSALGFSARELLHVITRLKNLKNISMIMLKDRSIRNDILLIKTIYECL